MSKRLGFLVYGIACYAVFFACFFYSIAFVGGFGVVPKTIDSGVPGPIGFALAVDLGLLSLFAVQHSVMARPAFKRVWTRIVAHPAERPTYVLLSTLCLALLYAFWQPIGGTVWHVEDPIGRGVLHGVYFLGWALLLYATLLIDHFDLFGLRQAWFGFRAAEYTHQAFGTPGLYRFVRHPIYVAWFVIFWATPTMSPGHLLLAVATTAYIVAATFFEERDLVEHFGAEYADYPRSTPRFVPRLAHRAATPRTSTQQA